MYSWSCLLCIKFYISIIRKKQKFNYALEDSKEVKTENLLKSGNFEKSKVET